MSTIISQHLQALHWLSVTSSFLLWHTPTMLFLSLFHIWSTCISHKADMPFTYVYHIVTLCFTCVCLKANTPLHIFKPVVRHLLFTENLIVLNSEPLNLRQYLAIGILRVSELEHWLELDTWLLDCRTLIVIPAQYWTQVQAVNFLIVHKLQHFPSIFFYSSSFYSFIHFSVISIGWTLRWTYDRLYLWPLYLFLFLPVFIFIFIFIFISYVTMSYLLYLGSQFSLTYCSCRSPLSRSSSFSLRISC